jgi:hypothetical protein
MGKPKAKRGVSTPKFRRSFRGNNEPLGVVFGILGSSWGGTTPHQKRKIYNVIATEFDDRSEEYMLHLCQDHDPQLRGKTHGTPGVDVWKQ